MDDLIGYGLIQYDEETITADLILEDFSYNNIFYLAIIDLTKKSNVINHDNNNFMLKHNEVYKFYISTVKKVGYVKIANFDFIVKKIKRENSIKMGDEEQDLISEDISKDLLNNGIIYVRIEYKDTYKYIYEKAVEQILYGLSIKLVTDDIQNVIDRDVKHRNFFRFQQIKEFNYYNIKVGQAQFSKFYCNNKLIFFDCGKSEKVSQRIFNKPDILIVSHWHKDHYNAIIRLNSLDNTICISPQNYPKTASVANTLAYIANFKSVLYTVNTDFTFNIEKYKFDVFNSTGTTINNSGMYMLITNIVDNKSILCTGDASYKYMNNLFTKYSIIASVIPHHGALENNINYINNNLSKVVKFIIPVGKNGYGHPNPTTISNHNVIAPVYNTSDSTQKFSL